MIGDSYDFDGNHEMQCQIGKMGLSEAIIYWINLIYTGFPLP